jgi:hypothetical protein
MYIAQIKKGVAFSFLNNRKPFQSSTLQACCFDTASLLSQYKLAVGYYGAAGMSGWALPIAGTLAGSS